MRPPGPFPAACWHVALCVIFITIDMCFHCCLCRCTRVPCCRERLQELRDHMLSSSVGVAASDFLPVVCDVTKEAEVVNLPKIITKHWPDTGIDVLVNNAGGPRH